jgi:hypothetical protein
MSRVLVLKFHDKNKKVFFFFILRCQLLLFWISFFVTEGMLS